MRERGVRYIASVPLKKEMHLPITYQIPNSAMTENVKTGDAFLELLIPNEKNNSLKSPLYCLTFNHISNDNAYSNLSFAKKGRSYII